MIPHTPTLSAPEQQRVPSKAEHARADTPETRTEKPHRSILERIGEGIGKVRKKITRAIERQIDVDRAYNIHIGRDSLAAYEYPLLLWEDLRIAQERVRRAEADVQFTTSQIEPCRKGAIGIFTTRLSDARKHAERMEKKNQENDRRVANIEDMMRSRAWEKNWRYVLDPSFHVKHYMEPR